MKNIFIYFLLLFSLSVEALAGDEFETKFMSGRDLYNQGRYTAAMEVLLPITKDDPGNRFVEYAHYYYSLSAFKAGMFTESKTILLQLNYRYPNWDKIQEARYLMANVYFEEGKFRWGMNQLKEVNTMDKDVSLMKGYYFNKLTLDSMKAIQSAYANDQVLAEVLARKLALSSPNEKDKMLLEYLVQEYKLDRTKFIANKNTVFKKNYAVAVLLPFQYNEIKSENSERSNQYVLDMYEGMQMAVDSLNALGGPQIQLIVYDTDTDKDPSKLTKILQQPEIKKMDLIIGPVYPAQIAMVSDFANKNQLTVLNPLSVNSKTIENTQSVFMYQPTLEWQAGQTARYTSANFTVRKNVAKDTIAKKKNVIIFYGKEKKDSMMAVYYKDSVTKYGLVVTHFERITAHTVAKIEKILSDSVKLLRVSHIFISDVDQAVAANLISRLEIARQNVPVIARKEWLDFTLLTYEQFERRQVYFIDPGYYTYGTSSYYDFRKRYIDKVGVLPSQYSFQGYDMMLLFGRSLTQYGTLFRDGLSKEGLVRGKLIYGADFSKSVSNTFVPLTYFEGQQLRIVNGY